VNVWLRCSRFSTEAYTVVIFVVRDNDVVVRELFVADRALSMLLDESCGSAVSASQRMHWCPAFLFSSRCAEFLCPGGCAAQQPISVNMLYSFSANQLGRVSPSPRLRDALRNSKPAAFLSRVLPTPPGRVRNLPKLGAMQT